MVHPAAAPPLTVNCSGFSGLVVTMNHSVLDVGELFSMHGVLTKPTSNGTKGWAWTWTNLAPGLKANSSSTSGLVYGNVTQPGNWTLNATVHNNSTPDKPMLYHCRANFIVNPDMLIELGAEPSSGPAPLTVMLVANVAATSGSGPFTASWILGDQSVSIGSQFNHTYEEPGLYHLEVWVNDTTAVYDSNFDHAIGSYLGFLNITVSPAPTPSKGPLGLGKLGWVIVGGFAVVLIAAIVYSVLTRHRPKPLPRAERWMVEGTVGRAGGVSGDRPKGPPPPGGPPSEPPSGLG